MVVDKERWEEFFSGLIPYDCAYGLEDRLCFILLGPMDDDGEFLKRILFIRRERPIERRFYVVDVEGSSFATVAANDYTERPEVVVVDTGRQVYSYDDGDDRIEKRINGKIKGYDGLAIIAKIVRVQQTLYAIGSPAIYKRLGISKWKREDIPFLIGDEDVSFFDLSGFSDQDLYAVGEAGSVWHYSGAWKQVAFPSNENLRNVCCAGDGKVYIVGQSGTIYAGRNDQWETLLQQDIFEYYNDIAWFDNKLWLASDYELHTFENGKLRNDTYPAEIQGLCKRLDISPDGTQMLTCGGYGAALFDGKEWQILFDARAFGEYDDVKGNRITDTTDHQE